MDHDPLTPLFSPLTTLKGVGPAVAPLLGKAVGGERVIDLLFHLPESYTDRRQRPTIADARTGQVATLAVEVVRIEPPANQRQPWRVVVTDGTGFAEYIHGGDGWRIDAFAGAYYQGHRNGGAEGYIPREWVVQGTCHF